MQIGPFTIMRTKALQLAPLSGRGGWWSVIREPYTGAWQRNDEIKMDTALSFSAVFGCTTLIVGDIGKLTLRLVSQDINGIWNEIENAAYSPVLRRPNRYQNRSQFVENWITSKLNSGNTYVLKQRDQRGVVNAMYILDPTRVTPLVAEDGSVYYELRRDDLSGLRADKVTVPASEIIHDRMNCLFHPLVGLSPIFACAMASKQGINIINNSSSLFANGSIPSGVVMVPGAISDETAARLKTSWEEKFSGNNVGKVAILSDNMKYEGMAYNPVNMQLVEQLKLSAEIVCTSYHVPAYLVDIGQPPPYANVEPLIQKYFSQCLHSLINALELSLDEGLSLGRQFGNTYGTEFDPDDLIWLNAEARSRAAKDGIGSGGMSPNEARGRYLSLGPVDGGETPYLQEQNWPLRLLAARELPARQPTSPTELPGEDEDTLERAASFASVLHRKSVEAGLYTA
jgi:HK97 family phage portal protein